MFVWQNLKWLRGDVTNAGPPSTQTKKSDKQRSVQPLIFRLRLRLRSLQLVNLVSSAVNR